MAIYRKGEASLAADGTVTGYGTNWKDQLALVRIGATIVFLNGNAIGAIGTVSAIVSETQLQTIQSDGAVVARGKYFILLHDSLTVDGLAQNVAETLRYYQSSETEIADALDYFRTFDWEKFEKVAKDVKANAAAAKVSETNAKTSETNAKGSENAAASSKNAAAASQAEAKASETNAKTSETNAKASENAASGSKTAAAGSATDAAASKAAAAASQAAAKTSETNSKTSETNAKASENASLQSKNAAAGSATAAKTSETNSKTSETRAKTSETNSAASATKATTEADRAKAEADRAAASNPDNALKKAANLSDVADVEESKKNLGLSFLIQTSSWTQVYAPSSDGTLGRGDWGFTIANDGTWGTRNKSTGEWKPLSMSNGGTGANNAASARSNLQLDRFQQYDASTQIKAPSGNVRLTLTDGSWSVYNDSTSTYVPLGVGAGGTGSTTAYGARANLYLGDENDVRFKSLTLQPTASGGLSVINLVPYGSSSGSYPKSQILGMPDGSVQLHEYDASNTRKRYFFADQYRHGTSKLDRTIMTNGDFGVGAGSGSYSTPANHGPENSFISGGGGGLSWCPAGAGWQSSYGDDRTGQMFIQPNGNVIFRWLQANSETAISTTPYTTLQNAGTSDINLKHVNGDLDVNVALENIENMEFKRFYYLDDEHQTERRGVIAQQIETIDPEYVHSGEATGKMTLDLNPLLMDCLAAIKALSAKVKDLEIEIESLKGVE